MRFPERLARFNRYVTNPIQRLWAGKVPPFAIIEHVGRRSGKAYRTPVNIYKVPDGYVIFLTYGPSRDWVRNLAAAGGGKLVYRGRTYEFADPRVMPAADVLGLLGKGPATLLRGLKLEFVLTLILKKGSLP